MIQSSPKAASTGRNPLAGLVLGAVLLISPACSSQDQARLLPDAEGWHDHHDRFSRTVDTILGVTLLGAWLGLWIWASGHGGGSGCR